MKKKVMQDVVEEKVEATAETEAANEKVEEVKAAETAAVAAVAVAEEPNAEEEVAIEQTAEVAADANVDSSDKEAKPSAGAAVKEWFRKQIVNLKKAPQRIPMLFLLIASLCYMLILFNYSKAINESSRAPQLSATGLCVFIVTLLSLLVLVSYLNAFPKRKKVNWFFIALVIVMVAGMIACDIVVYLQFQDNLNSVSDAIANSSNMDPCRRSFTHTILHIVFLGIFSVVFACLPLIKIGLNKINTKKVVESATSEMKEEIDLQE